MPGLADNTHHKNYQQGRWHHEANQEVPDFIGRCIEGGQLIPAGALVQLRRNVNDERCSSAEIIA